MKGYKREGDVIHLEMTRGDYHGLLLALGLAAGGCLRESGGAGTEMFWSLLALANRINTGNPEFKPYEIPEEFRDRTPPARTV